MAEMNAEVGSMETVIEKAGKWWAEQLSTVPSLPKDRIVLFQQNMNSLIYKKIKDHWFPDSPLKGQAYRSVSLDMYGRLDPLLEQAAKASGISDLFGCFSYVESIVMWIDPFEVAVRTHWTYSQGGKEQVIYKSKPQTPSKPMDVPSSPLSSSPYSTPIKGFKVVPYNGILSRPSSPMESRMRGLFSDIPYHPALHAVPHYPTYYPPRSWHHDIKNVLSSQSDYYENDAMDYHLNHQWKYPKKKEDNPYYKNQGDMYLADEWDSGLPLEAQA
jgi:hypothetical protein